jgi:DNA-binding GntR family transcriptional regulator
VAEIEPGLELIEPGDLLADRAYERLRDAILSNRLPPGTQLSVPELARQLSVSRSPVREAVQRLIYEGLAIHVPYRGGEVCIVQVEDLRQLYVVREVLEGLAARLATDRIDAAGLTKLRVIIAAHEEVVTSGDGRAHIELDMTYHRLIRETAGNEHLSTILKRIEGKAHLALHHVWRGEDGPRLALEEHKEILDRMAAGDPDGAERAARAHIARLSVRLAQNAGSGRAGGRNGSA